MSATPEEFRNITWNNTTFDVFKRTKDELIIVFDSVSLAAEQPRKITMTFVNPVNEWASLWDSGLNEWVEHPDTGHPIGHEIIEATAKQVGKIKFSLGGNHARGRSRWGFTADAFEIRG